MIIVTCATPEAWHERSRCSIIDLWPKGHVFWEIDPDDPFQYGRILADYWQQGESFAVVEPDIVIREDVAEAIMSCKCDYGCFPYAWRTDVGPALGCTWFRAPFLARYPDAMKKVQAQNVTWRQLDVVLMRHVLAREYGEQPHVHLPAVEHLNPDKQLLPDASREPMLYVPHW